MKVNFCHIVLGTIWVFLSLPTFTLSSDNKVETVECENDGTCTKSGEESCKDRHENCPGWAKQGECDANPHYMLRHCQLSCESCFKDKENEKQYEQYENIHATSNYHTGSSEEEILDQDCVDLHQMCSVWARLGECLLNPNFMTAACRFSCFLCFNEKDSRRRRESPELMEKRKRLSQINYGPIQIQKNEETIKRIKEIDVYVHETISSQFYDEVRHSCTNQDAQCAYWSTQGKCESEPISMIQNCRLACMFCDLTEPFGRCYETTKLGSELKAVGIPTRKEVFDDIESGKYDDWKPTILSKDPWLIQFNSFVTREERRYMINLGNSVGWYQISSPESSSSKSSFSTSVLSEDVPMTSLYKSLLEKISHLTKSTLSHIEHVELIKYTNFGDSYERHSDYQIHDDWKPAGPRMFSFILCLSATYADSAEDMGGAIGFPKLDWMTVKPKPGQALFWSNVKDRNLDDSIQREEIFYETLPLLKGELIMAHIWIHSGDWQSAFNDDCI